LTLSIQPNAMLDLSLNFLRSGSALGHARHCTRGPAIGALGLPPTTVFTSPNHRPHAHSAFRPPQMSPTIPPLVPSHQDGKTAPIARGFACPPAPTLPSPQIDVPQRVPRPTHPSPSLDLAR
ncbi:hypothetical protein HDZ31DRAFT_49132, partial [Schizophyllum fasciatum]